MTKPVSDTLPTRRSLLSRLKNWEDQESWADFFETYWRLIYGFAVKTGLSDAEAQDVVQETVVSVAKRMRDFKYDPAAGSFKSWLLLITRRRIADYHRKRQREPRGGDGGEESDSDRPVVVEQIADRAPAELEALWEAEWQRNLLEAAIQRVRSRVDPRQFQIFDCYVLKEWSPKEVTRVLGVSVGQVYLAKHRVSALVKKEAERIEQGRAGDPPSTAGRR
ncbi:MAG: sigma-70 family RNA polymerase sigma factor [Verrucomicrobia bacterium]|nr:sigma-70 family RNA polymerase sigma factor [Verrucomicrobiota bacterium]